MTPADLTDDHVELARKMAHGAVCRLRADVRLRIADDVLSDAMFGLVKAARDYDEQRGPPFRAYASIRIRGTIGDGLRRMGFSVHASRRHKMLPSLMMDRLLADGDAGSDSNWETILVDYDNLDRQDNAENAIAVHQAFACLDRWSFSLLPQQKQVYDLLRSGLTQRAIGDQMHFHEARISQIMRAIRLRLLAENPVQLPWVTEET